MDRWICNRRSAVTRQMPSSVMQRQGQILDALMNMIGQECCSNPVVRVTDGKYPKSKTCNIFLTHGQAMYKPSSHRFQLLYSPMEMGPHLLLHSPMLPSNPPSWHFPIVLTSHFQFPACKRSSGNSLNRHVKSLTASLNRHVKSLTASLNRHVKSLTASRMLG